MKSVASWLAHRRYNYIDALAFTTFSSFYANGNGWWGAALTFALCGFSVTTELWVGKHP